MSDTLTNALAQAGRSSSVLSGIANPAVVNPLAGYGSAISAVQGIQGLQEKAAQQAAGQAYQGAIDPSTGEFDPNKFRTLLSQSPAAAMAAGPALANTQQISSDQLNQARAKAAWVNARAGAQLQSGDFSDTGMLRIFQDGIANGTLTMPEVQRQMAILPPDAAGRKQWLQEHQDTAASVQQQYDQRFGTTGSQTGPGGTTQGFVQQSPRAGGAISSPPQAGAPQGLSAEQTAAYQQWLKSPRDYPDPANSTVTKHGTNETFLGDSGVPAQYVYPGGAPAAPGTQSPLGTGRLPPALQNPNNKPAATSASTTAPAPSPAGTGISGPTPAQAATAEATKQQGTLGPPRFQAEADAGTGAQSQQATLGNMLADTAQFTTGPLAGIVGKVRNLAGNFGLNINTDAQSAKESFNKLAAGLANAQGAGSDQRMAVNINANPHEELSPAGVDLVTRQLQGNADYLQARAKLAQKYTNKADYPGFQNSIAGLDPRVFQLSRMTGPQRTTYWNALSDTAQTELGAAIRNAKGMGVLGN